LKKKTFLASSYQLAKIKSIHFHIILEDGWQDI